MLRISLYLLCIFLYGCKTSILSPREAVDFISKNEMSSIVFANITAVYHPASDPDKVTMEFKCTMSSEYADYSLPDQRDPNYSPHMKNQVYLLNLNNNVYTLQEGTHRIYSVTCLAPNNDQNYFHLKARLPFEVPTDKGQYYLGDIIFHIDNLRQPHKNRRSKAQWRNTEFADITIEVVDNFEDTKRTYKAFIKNHSMYPIKKALVKIPDNIRRKKVLDKSGQKAQKM